MVWRRGKLLERAKRETGEGGRRYLVSRAGGHVSRIEGDGTDPLSVARIGMYTFARTEVPQLDETIFGSGHARVPAVPIEAPHGRSMLGEGGCIDARVHIPHCVNEKISELMRLIL